MSVSMCNPSLRIHPLPESKKYAVVIKSKHISVSFNEDGDITTSVPWVLDCEIHPDFVPQINKQIQSLGALINAGMICKNDDDDDEDDDNFVSELF